MKRTSQTITYWDRKTKSTREIPIYMARLTIWLHHTTIGKLVMTYILPWKFISLILTLPKYLPHSKREIKPFIDKYKLVITEFADPISSFHSFNDFFIRKLKNTARPIDGDEKTLISPCDSQILAFENIEESTTFKVKNEIFHSNFFRK